MHYNRGRVGGMYVYIYNTCMCVCVCMCGRGVGGMSDQTWVQASLIQIIVVLSELSLIQSQCDRLPK